MDTFEIDLAKSLGKNIEELTHEDILEHFYEKASEVSQQAAEEALEISDINELMIKLQKIARREA